MKVMNDIAAFVGYTVVLVSVLLFATGQVHIYGAGATGMGRLLCIW